MQKVCRIVRMGIFWLALAFAVGVVLAGVFFPRMTEKYLPFRLYTVLTDSMAPAAPPMSLVLVRQVTPDEPLELEEGQIITCRAERFGKQIIQTHRFSHTEWDEELGQTLYRTHPQHTTVPDFYKTTRQDILGVYVFSVPYAGKIPLFLKSPWGLLLLAEEVTIFLLNQWVKARWEERDAEEKPLPALVPAAE